jgi:TolA-binding protein
MKSPRAAGTLARAVLAATFALLLASCFWRSAPEPPLPAVVAPPPRDYDVALGMLQRGDVLGAERLFRQVASSCPNGEEGRKALLFLSSLWLDRHPQATPDSAAVLAARVLSLPDADLLERSMARSIYLLALELGGDPALRPARSSSPRSLALAFSNCEQPTPPFTTLLPELGREPLSTTVRRLEAERDSLAQKAKATVERSGALEARIQELESQLRASHAELERLRRLLGGRDTTTTRSRP